MKSELKTLLIKELLNASTMQLAPATLEKLRSARTNALNHQRLHQAAPVLAWLGYHSGEKEHFHFSKQVNWAIAVLFVAFLISAAAIWQNYATEHEICDVDIAILTDDLPIHVYVD